MIMDVLQAVVIIGGSLGGGVVVGTAIRELRANSRSRGGSQ